MPHPDHYLRLDGFPAAKPRTLLVSSPSLGVTAGQNLGNFGYSYDFVLRAFQPLLKRWGEMVEVRRPESQFGFAARQARLAGREPVVLSLRPLQHVYLARTVPNVLFPFWEFPQIPDCDFNNNPRNNWVRVANQASLILTASEFTAAALARSGIRTPVRVVPVPVDPHYFEIPDWQPDQSIVLECPAYVFPQGESDPAPAHALEEFSGRRPSLAFRIKTRVKALLRRAWALGIKPCLPRRLAEALVEAKNAGLVAWRAGNTPLPAPAARLELSGIVYTTILNPDDHRKNWEDLLTAYLLALRDRSDATLLIKLVTSRADAVRGVLARYYQLGIKHRCRVALVTGYLSDETMLALVRASTYYLNASRAEGACLPLQDFLAAGRPGVAPAHTSLIDYFDDSVGFVVDSHAEPCPWPEDLSGRLTTHWHRIVWSSLYGQIRASYGVASDRPEQYRALGARSRRRMAAWASVDSVWPRLQEALSLVVSREDSAARPGGGPHWPFTGPNKTGTGSEPMCPPRWVPVLLEPPSRPAAALAGHEVSG